MKLVSIHSHGGGVGKTTLAIGIAKKLAQAEKVCLIETDIGGAGLRYLLGLEEPKKYLNDFIIAEPVTGEINLEESPEILLNDYKGEDVPLFKEVSELIASLKNRS